MGGGLHDLTAGLRVPITVRKMGLLRIGAEAVSTRLLFLDGVWSPDYVWKPGRHLVVLTGQRKRMCHGCTL